jgi:hypothetical protein
MQRFGVWLSPNFSVWYYNFRMSVGPAIGGVLYDVSKIKSEGIHGLVICDV